MARRVSLTECSACANGYDGSLMTSIIAMKSFQSTIDTTDTGPKASVIFSLYAVYVSLSISTPCVSVFGDPNELTRELQRCHGWRSVCRRHF
jgi:hypothetical protein